MIKETNSWLKRQTQRLREQGLRKCIHAAIKKILRSLIAPCADLLHELPRLRKVVLYILKATGLSTRVKSLLTIEPKPKVIHLSARALEIRQELKRVLDRLERAQ
jgi:hypothetical protein